MSKHDMVDYRLDGELSFSSAASCGCWPEGHTGIDTTSIPSAPAEAWEHARRGPVDAGRAGGNAPVFGVKEP